jgi:hypothetical protein
MLKNSEPFKEFRFGTSKNDVQLNRCARRASGDSASVPITGPETVGELVHSQGMGTSFAPLCAAPTGCAYFSFSVTFSGLPSTPACQTSPVTVSKM